MSANTIVDELICSAQHAIISGKLKDEIVETFANFYESEEIKNARKHLMLPDKRASRPKDEKSNLDKKRNSIAEILACLLDKDFKMKDITFLAKDLSRIRFVPFTLRDEVQLRSELSELRNKLDDLANCFTECIKDKLEMISSIGEKVSNFNPSSVNVSDKVSNKCLAEPRIHPKPTYLDIANKQSTYERSNSVTGNSLSTTPMIPSQSEQPLKHSDLNGNENPVDKTWTTVRRKSKSLNKNQVVGGAESKRLKIVCKQRGAVLFISRCSPETTIDELKNYITESDFGYKLNEIEKWNSRRSEYSSFKISFSLDTSDTLSKFLRDTIDASKWPAGMFVKQFNFGKNVSKQNNKRQ